MGTIELDSKNAIGLRVSADNPLGANRLIRDGGRDLGRGGVVARGGNLHPIRRSNNRPPQGALKKVNSVDELRAALVRGRKRIGDCFRLLDRNGDGKVTKAEFAAALPLLGFNASGRAALDEIFDSIGKRTARDGRMVVYAPICT